MVPRALSQPVDPLAVFVNLAGRVRCFTPVRTGSAGESVERLLKSCLNHSQRKKKTGHHCWRRSLECHLAVAQSDMRDTPRQLAQGCCRLPMYSK
jgi:hypothetical protein